MVAVETGVQLGHQAAAVRLVRAGVDAHDDAVGVHEVVDRRAFFEELGVGGHIKAQGIEAPRLQGLRDHGAHPVGGAHRHGRFVEHQLEVLHVLANAARHRQHMLQIGRAVFLGRRAHGDHQDLAMRNRLGHIGGEVQPAGRAVARDHRVQARLVNRHAPSLQLCHARRIAVEAQHTKAQIGQA